MKVVHVGDGGLFGGDALEDDFEYGVFEEVAVFTVEDSGERVDC